ncbi:MAG: imidazole glycerol phosphate synthase subunit HisF [Terriglobia bacterium]
MRWRHRSGNLRKATGVQIGVLAKRIIPCLDCKDGRVVKGVRFLELRDAGDPAELAEAYNRQGADELVLLDISASCEGRATLMETVNQVASRLFIPLTVGGGIRTPDDARRLLTAGADKISVNTAAVESPELIEEMASRFGSQAVVVAIDARRRRAVSDPDRVKSRQPQNAAWTVTTHGGSRETPLDACEWAERVESLGAGEILLTSMDTDGVQTGFDCELTAAVARRVHIPVIASGGAGEPRHFAQVFLKGHADAALAASIFHFGQYSLPDLKSYLRHEGIPVRMS